MNSQDAIFWLRIIDELMLDDSADKRKEALKMAIEALQEQKTGRWIKGIIGWNCSECTLGTNQNWFNYCPNCGARMEV